MEQLVDFAQVRAAMSLRKTTHDAMMAAGNKPSYSAEYMRDPAIREQLSEWNRKTREAEAAQNAVIAAYATEMLPAILGGEWKTTKSILYAPTGHGGRDYVAGNSTELFDHPVHLRRKVGGRWNGPLTWDTCALIGQPYLSVHAGERDKLPEPKAIALAERFGIGVWTRDDLSGWYPGWTVLVLAARGLQHERAAEFGFVALAGV